MTNLSPSLFTDDMGVCAAEAMNPLGCPRFLPAWSLKMLSCLVLVIRHIYHTFNLESVDTLQKNYENQCIGPHSLFSSPLSPPR